MTTRTIDTASARHMAETNAIRGASIIGRSGGWMVKLKVGDQEKPLGTQRSDKPRTWATLDAAVEYLRRELGLVRFDLLDASNYSKATTSRPRRQDAAERMKRAHEAAAHDAWFRDQVQAALGDSRSPIADSDARARFAARKKALLQAGDE